MDYHSRKMIAALEDRNQKLRDDNKGLAESNARLVNEMAKYRKAGEFYLRMQRHILGDENIGDAWNDFYTIYALAYPDIRELN